MNPDDRNAHRAPSGETPSRSQLEFSALTAGFAAAGINELPQGAAELTRREMRLVMGVLEHGQMARAAIEAGYSAESAGAIASNAIKKPKVLAFYRRCVEKVASQAELVMRRICERSVIFHAKAKEAAQEKAQAGQWLLASTRQEHGRNAKDVKTFEMARDRAQREERHYAQLARAEDALLLNALGRLKVSPGAEPINVVSDEARAYLMELARQGIELALPEEAARN